MGKQLLIIFIGIIALVFVFAPIKFYKDSYAIHNTKLSSITPEKIIEYVVVTPTPIPTPTPKPPLKKENVIKAIDKHLKGRLKYMGTYFYMAGQKYKVNSMLMASIAIHETANGMSDVLKRCNNVGGINRRKGFPSSGRYAVYESVAEGIYDMAKLLRNNYLDKGLNDIESIGNKYCPLWDKDNGKYGMSNESWIPTITRLYAKILKDAES